MKNRRDILKELEAAIDSADMSAIDLALERLASEEPETITPEDAQLFSARILKLSEEKHNMKSFGKTSRIAVAVAAVLLMGVTVYAAVSMKMFSFQSGDRFVTIRTTDAMTEQEAKAMAEGAQETRDFEAEGANVVYAEEVPMGSFSSVAEAEAGMGMTVPLPAAIPDLPFSEAQGQTMVWGEGVETRSLWITYGSVESGRMFGVSVFREVTAPGEQSTHLVEQGFDKGSLGSYTSKTGIKYNTLTETDDTGELTMHMAHTMIGEYDYVLQFYGFSEAERQAVIDSTDLSAYNG